jgi:hypothetical protein
VTTNKCIVCDKRPAVRGDIYCAMCRTKVEAATQSREDSKVEPRYYIAWKGTVVGLYPVGEADDGQMHYKPRLESLDVEALPKSRTINIDQFVPGYDRSQIAKLKRTCLMLAGA